ncbi:hypothetical protein RGUI_4123 [Rhodovulum sp. P5]|nr:hypothetical protein RGUI_4123 [Rhodovulum sp. P5]
MGAIDVRHYDGTIDPANAPVLSIQSRVKLGGTWGDWEGGGAMPSMAETYADAASVTSAPWRTIARAQAVFGVWDEVDFRWHIDRPSGEANLVVRNAFLSVIEVVPT